MAGLTNYTIKDLFGNFIDLSYVLVKRTTITGVPNIVTNFKSNGTDIGRLFEPSTFSISSSPVGTTRSDTYYTYLEITAATTITVINGRGVQFYYLAVGGGGASGIRNSNNGSGGGGGGGMVAGTFSLSSGSITVTVGNGGSGFESLAVGGDSTINIPNYSLITAGGGGNGGGVSGSLNASPGRATNGSGGGGGGSGNAGEKTGNGLGGTGGASTPGVRGGGGGGMGGNGSDGNVSDGAGGAGLRPSDLGFCPNGTQYSTTYYSYGGNGSPKTPQSVENTNAAPGSGAAGGGGLSAGTGKDGIVIIAYALFRA